MNITIEKQSVAGIELSLAYPTGAVDVPTMICLHGIGGDDASFQPQLDGLSDRYRVISWNMPGYGQSENLTDYTFKHLAEVLNRLVTELNLKQVTLVGQSIGGMIAQEYAHHYPESLSSLILIATTAAFGGRDDTFKQEFLAARLKPLDQGVTMAQMAKDAMPHITGSAASANAVQAAIDSMSKVDEATYRQVLKCLVTFNRRSELSEISCPVCLIAGSEDTNAPAPTMQKMASKINGVEYHELVGAGHLVNLEMPDETNQIVSRFMEKTH